MVQHICVIRATNPLVRTEPSTSPHSRPWIYQNLGSFRITLKLYQFAFLREVRWLNLTKTYHIKNQNKSNLLRHWITWPHDTKHLLFTDSVEKSGFVSSNPAGLFSFQRYSEAKKTAVSVQLLHKTWQSWEEPVCIHGLIYIYIFCVCGKADNVPVMKASSGR